MIALANVNGRIGRLEIKTSKKSGNQYVEFSLANDRGFGENRETDWYHCIAFDKVAERLINAKADKGSLIQVVGSQALEKFKRKDGSDGMAAKITLYDWAYVPIGKKSDGQPSAPAAAGAPAPAPAGGGEDFVEIEDDGDLPF